MKFQKIALRITLIAVFFLILSSCSVGIADGATAVQDFQPKKYLGKWYEIARLDYRFEENLNNVTATYSQNPDGTIKVDNKGYDYVEKKWKGSIGEARFVKEPSEARLKVSFFKPFWSGYNVIDLVDYKYALVVGKSTKYLWILSRDTQIPEEVKQRFLKKANELNFPTKDLIWVEHNQ